VDDNNRNRIRPRRTPLKAIQWWWQTRVQSWWTVRLPAKKQRRLNAERTLEFVNTPESLEEVFASDKVQDDANSAHSSITVILTLYKRSEYLPAQIEAIRNQSVPPKEIWIWCNSSDVLIPDMSHLADRVVVSNSNWKFWGRFSLASMVRTRYVAIFDDDILPERDWFKNCLQTYQSVDGILGGSGVVLPETGGYSSKHKVGWNGHHLQKPKEVDLVGHAWFVKKAYIKYLWFEEPVSWENGEDIHFSYMVLKHAGLGTWVPPHPDSSPSLWSCRPGFGKAVGRTNSATFKSAGHHSVRDEIVMSYRIDGWQVASQRQTADDNVSTT